MGTGRAAGRPSWRERSGAVSGARDALADEEGAMKVVEAAVVADEAQAEHRAREERSSLRIALLDAVGDECAEGVRTQHDLIHCEPCLLYTSPSPRDS